MLICLRLMLIDCRYVMCSAFILRRLNPEVFWVERHLVVMPHIGAGAFKLALPCILNCTHHKFLLYRSPHIAMRPRSFIESRPTASHSFLTKCKTETSQLTADQRIVLVMSCIERTGEINDWEIFKRTAKRILEISSFSLSQRKEALHNPQKDIA